MHDAQDAAPAPVMRQDYRPPAFLVDTVDLHFDLDPSATVVRSRLTLRRNTAHADAAAPLRLDGEALHLLALRLDGATLPESAYTFDAGGALLLPRPPDAFTLEVDTRVAPDANSEYSGLYVSGGNFFTQCEAEGFRRITYFPDRPDVMARFTVTLAADRARCPVLLSNGNPDGAGDLPDGTGRAGSIRTPNRAICSRWSPAIWSPCATISPRAPAGPSISPSGCARATRTAAATPCRR